VNPAINGKRTKPINQKGRPWFKGGLFWQFYAVMQMIQVITMI